MGGDRKAAALELIEREGPDAVRLALTRDRIVRAAIDLIEREGVEAVSMRRVGGELGVAAMSLYNHVPNKAALLDAVAERITADVAFLDEPSADWREGGRELVRAFRRAARDYPRCTMMVCTRQATSTAALRPVEHALALTEQAGFDGQTSIRIMRALISYALGAIVRENAFSQMLPALRASGPLDLTAFPHIEAHAGLLVTDDGDADFEFGLDLLIGAIERLRRA